MPSPFPGMDPYLEQAEVWHDFHQRFVPDLAAALGPLVRPDYIVRIDEHVYVHSLDLDERRLIGRPDVHLAESGRRPRSETVEPGATAIAAPVRVRLSEPAVDEERVPFVEIVDRSSRTVVTVVEVLSPSNKRPGADRDQYLRKRREFVSAGANLVEIDLLRGGTRLLPDTTPSGTYCVLVGRVGLWPEVDVWPIPLRQRLPVIPIPLGPERADAPLDLQTALDRVYEAAGYADYVYESDPASPLAPTDAAWARDLLAASASR